MKQIQIRSASLGEDNTNSSCIRLRLGPMVNDWSRFGEALGHEPETLLGPRSATVLHGLKPQHLRALLDAELAPLAFRIL